MKRFLIPFTIIILIVSFLVFSWWTGNTKPVSSDSTKIRFIIPKGLSALEIGNSLYKNGLIKSSLAFKICVQVTGNAKKLKPGQFTLSPNMSLDEIIKSLLRGPEELWVTIPEGLRREQVVEKFINTFEMSGTQAVNFRQAFLEESKGMEGYLFPDTYLFPRDVKASIVVAKMKSVFDQKVDSKMKEKINKSGLTLNQVLTLASIIERETKSQEERPVVSGILMKRFEADWPLQADASLQYGISSSRCEAPLRQGFGGARCEWWPILTKEDLEINSPYNTYKFTGFPPAPIANPGLSSINAAVNPQDSLYWFYLHDPDGNVHFAKTLEEHNRNVSVFLEK
jgi:UPF0755 protein